MPIVALLDAGVVYNFYTKNTNEKIVQLMDDINTGKVEGRIFYPTLVEIFSHLCKMPGGVSFAEVTISSFLITYKVEIIPIDESIMFKAGRLKCQFRAELSNVDCISIAYALNQNVTFHTTEKNLGELIPKLKLVMYRFKK